MDERGKEMPLSSNPESVRSEKTEPTLRPMVEAIQRIDSGNGKPEDVTIAIDNLVEHSTSQINKDQVFHWEGAGSRQLHQVLELKRMQEGGSYGKMLFCSTTIRNYHDHALYHASSDPKEAEVYVQKAANWEKVQQTIRAQQLAQPGSQQ